MAGGGVNPSFSLGETDSIGYGAVRHWVGTHFFHSTLPALLCFDHHHLPYPFQGLAKRLTNITRKSSVGSEILG